MRFGKIVSLVCLLFLTSTAFAGGIQESKLVGSSYSVSELNSLSPYMKINKDYSVTFDISKAKANGLPKRLIQMGVEYSAYNNKSVAIIKSEGIYSGKLKALPESSKFNAVFDAMSSGSADATMRAATTTSNLVCGGSQQQPHICPARKNSGIFKATKTEISNNVKSQGFHNTYWPGCGSTGYSCPEDFTKWVNAYSCTWGSFRTQARILQQGSSWTYWTQTPEPNPEIFSYNWPVYWWGQYVQWWHNRLCRNDL